MDFGPLLLVLAPPTTIPGGFGAQFGLPWLGTGFDDNKLLAEFPLTFESGNSDDRMGATAVVVVVVGDCKKCPLEEEAGGDGLLVFFKDFEWSDETTEEFERLLVVQRYKYIKEREIRRGGQTCDGGDIDLKKR